MQPLGAKFTCTEKLRDVTLISRKYQSNAAADPVWRQTAVRIVRARRERESTKVQTLFKRAEESQ